MDIALVPTGAFTGVADLEQKADDSGTVVWVLGTSNVAVTSASGAYVPAAPAPASASSASPSPQ